MKNALIVSLASAIFVGLVAWGSFDDLIKVVLSAAITFVTLFVGILILRAVGKEDEAVKPGSPRLK